MQSKSVRWIVIPGSILVVAVGTIVTLTSRTTGHAEDGDGGIVVLAYNDLGMHCMNEEFSEIAILPPFNNLRAQVIKRDSSPEILDEHLQVTYSIPTNTHSADKSNFWTHAEALFGVQLPPDVGLTGKGLAGTMEFEAPGYYEATGIPITPIDDTGRLNPFPLAFIRAVHEDGPTASTMTVIPVSSELTCNLCHQAEGVSTSTDILRNHDTLHGTNLEQNKPVLCASCHADNALGAPGVPGLPALSHAIHTAHADNVPILALENECYACHPGIRTQCQRDNHLAQGVDCSACHGGMTDVGNPAREPWVDLPRCEDCHNRPGFDFEEPGKLYKDSRGHGGVMCAACHGSPHAITPTLTAADNQQALFLQGHVGVINDCSVCHTEQPSDPFFHSIDD